MDPKLRPQLLEPRTFVQRLFESPTFDRILGFVIMVNISALLIVGVVKFAIAVTDRTQGHAEVSGIGRNDTSGEVFERAFNASTFDIITLSSEELKMQGDPDPDTSLVLRPR